MSVLAAAPPGVELLRCPTCRGTLDGDETLRVPRLRPVVPRRGRHPAAARRDGSRCHREGARGRGLGCDRSRPGLVRARRRRRRGASVPDPRLWLGRSHLEGERALVRPAARAPRAGDARARGRRGEVLGRAARHRGGLHVRRDGHPRRPEHRARPRRVLRAGRGPVPPCPGGRREPALSGRCVRRDLLRRDAPSRARPRTHGG